MWIILLLILIAVTLYFFLRPAVNDQSNKGIVGFISRGLDAGFSISQIRLLWRASRLSGMERPNQIYWSLDELDRCIHVIIEKYGLLTDHPVESAHKEIIGRLFEYRKNVEFNKPKYKSGINTTRDIPLNQPVKIRDNQVGIYDAEIVSNAEGYMVITYPKGDPLPLGFSWRGRILNIYFWRKGDAGYFFETKLLDNYKDSEEHKYLRMSHSDYLLRSQKRKSVRAVCEIPGQLYRFESSSSFTPSVEINPGLYCVVTDISEDGAALRVAGRAKRGLPLKLQFKIREHTVVMNGLVKNSRYDREKDFSDIHIESIPIEEKHQFAILSFVYDVDRSRKRAAKLKEQYSQTEELKDPDAIDEPEDLDYSTESAPIEVDDVEINMDTVDDAQLEEL